MTEASPPLTRMRPSYAATVAKKRTMRSSPPSGLVTLLITSFAVSFFIQVALQIFVSAEPQGISVPNWTDTVWHMGDVSLPAVKVVTFAVTIAAVVLLAVFLRRTLLGVAMRAAAEVVAIVAESPAPAMSAHARAAACVFSG